jgi:Zn finger protein HypA/HybF involved in hydrogenase expression
MGLIDWFKDRFGAEEAIQEPMRSCDRCAFEYPETSLVIDNGKVFCHDCHGKHKKSLAEAELKRKQAALANVKLKYYCYNCKFHFSRRQGFPLSLCPNCGSGNFVEEKRIL